MFADLAKLKEAMACFTDARRIAHPTMSVTLTAHNYSDLPICLIEAGFRITLFREEELNLETAFMALTKGVTA